MDIIQENTDDLNAVLRVKIEKPDYESRVEEVLQDTRKKARMDGFRPGKVPAGLIRKMYGKSVLLEELNKILSESISKYLQEKKLHILGEPLPVEEDPDSIDWDNDTEFNFRFDLGLAPGIEIAPTKKDKVPYYTIQVEKRMIDDTRANYARKFGSVDPVEFVSGNEILKGDFIQVEASGDEIENGIVAEDSTISMEVVKDDSIKTAFTGRKVGESVVIDVKKALPNEVELASVLRIDRSMVQEIAPDFRFDIKEISKFTEAEINQELFDRAFGEGKIKSEEEFKKQITKDIEANLKQEGEYRLSLDIRDYFLKKLSLELPSEFLKKWLMVTNKDSVTEEQLEKEFPAFEKDLKWQLIKDQVMKNHELEIKDEEIMNSARNFTRMQFAQYGLSDVPDEQLDSYAGEMLKRDEEKNKIVDRLKEEKVVETLKELITLDNKKITVDKFNKLYEKNS
jgi:trigger factor